MKATLEDALLVLWSRVTLDVDAKQLQVLGRPTLADELPATALATVATEVAQRDPDDIFGATQAFVLGCRYGSRAEVASALDDLASLLLTPYNAAPTTENTQALIHVTDSLVPDVDSTHGDLANNLSDAFGSSLEIMQPDSVGGPLSLSGPAAQFAAMVVDVSSNLVPKCRTKQVEVGMGGVPKKVTLVEVDTCTNKLFTDLVSRVDPMHWPQCNPAFLSVAVLGTRTAANDGWSATIKERVGAINGSIYETDLTVRYVTRPGLVAVSFDLAPNGTGDGRVTVDRGFISVTDEGDHRRVRVLKVYRIEDLDMYQTFICPLWCWQVAMSGWWCP